MLKPVDSCGECSIVIEKCSGSSCTETQCPRTERFEASLAVSLEVDYLAAIVALWVSIEIGSCSILLSSLLHVSLIMFAVFTIALLKMPAGKQSCSTVSADGTQPLRVCGHSGTLRQMFWQPDSSKTTQHQARSGHSPDHT
jgi:hypothetical protein